MYDPSILINRSTNIFQMICLMLATYMALGLTSQFLENKDSTSISYHQYSQSSDDKYPTFSVCFQGTSFHWYYDVAIFDEFGISSTEFTKLIRGETAFRYEYNLTTRLYKKEELFMNNGSNVNFADFHVTMADILVGLLFWTENPAHAVSYYNAENLPTVERPPFSIGYQTPEMICFTRNANDSFDDSRTYDELSLKTSKLRSKMYENTRMELIVHHPGQLMRSIIDPSFSAGFAFLKDKHVELKVSQTTVLRK